MTTPGHCTETTVHGLPVTVLNTRPDIETAKVLRRLDAVLELIRTYQPRRYRLLKRDVAGIVVQRYACRGAYLPPSHTCLVELTFLASADFSDAQIAASIVHEATHARLHRLGLTVTSAAAERACRRAEIALGRVVPDGAAVIARAEASLGLADDEVAPAVDWNLARLRVAAADRAALAGRDRVGPAGPPAKGEGGTAG